MLKALIPILVVIIVGVLPTPEGLDVIAQYFFSVFIVGIFATFMFALGYKKSALGKRILSSFMPSNTARSVGIIFPIAINIPLMFNSTPENEPRKLGSYISWGEWFGTLAIVMIPLFLYYSKS